MSHEQLPPWLVEEMTRRTVLRRGARFAGAGAFGLALASMSGTSAAAGSQITMMNYPGWMGKTTVADFKKKTGDRRQAGQRPDLRHLRGRRCRSPRTRAATTCRSAGRCSARS